MNQQFVVWFGQKSQLGTLPTLQANETPDLKIPIFGENEISTYKNFSNKLSSILSPDNILS